MSDWVAGLVVGAGGMAIGVSLALGHFDIAVFAAGMMAIILYWGRS